MPRTWNHRLAACLLTATLVTACGGQEATQIAVILPETGEWSDYGTEIKHGIEIAYEELQADDDGTTLELRWQDSGSDPAQAASLLQTAFSEGVAAAIGGVTSAEALAMVPATEEASRVLLSPSASSLQLSEAGRYFMRIFPTDFDEATRMGRFAAEDLKLESLMILAPESVYGASVYQVFRDAFETNGGSIQEIVEYGADPAYEALAAQAVAAKPQAIYLADFASGVGELIAALRAQGYEGAILTTSAFSPSLGSLASDASSIYLTRTAFDVDSEEPQVQKFVQAYEAKFGSEPGFFAAHGYDSLMVLATALKRSQGDSHTSLWLHLRGLREYTGVTGGIQFNEQGDVQRYPQIYLVREGALVSYSDYQEEIRQRREEIMRRLEQVRRDQARSGG